MNNLDILSYIIKLDNEVFNLKDLSILSCVSKLHKIYSYQTKLLNYKIINIKNNEYFYDIYFKQIKENYKKKDYLKYSLLNNKIIIYLLINYKNNILFAISYIEKNNILYLNKIYRDYKSYSDYDNMNFYCSILIKQSINSIINNTHYSKIWILCNYTLKHYYNKFGFKEKFLINFLNKNNNNKILAYEIPTKDKILKFLKTQFWRIHF